MHLIKVIFFTSAKGKFMVDRNMNYIYLELQL